MCQTAFSVIPSSYALPTLLTPRNTFPLPMAAATSQLFTSSRTQPGHWNSSDVTSLTDQIDKRPVLLRLLKMIQS